MLHVGEVQVARKLEVPGFVAVTVAVWGVVVLAAIDIAKLCDEIHETGMLVRFVPLESRAVATRACVPPLARLKGAVPPLVVAMLSETIEQVVKLIPGLVLALTLA
jgi:hypothetical protein